MYAGPTELADAVARATDLVHKDRVLSVLIVAAGSASTRRLAQALLLLCVWPGLDAIHRRRLVLFRCPEPELAAEIVNRFTECVQRLRLERVRCITATLVRNTERALVDARRRETAFCDRAVELSIDAADESPASSRHAPFGIPCGRWDASSIATLRDWLRQAVGQDADLVIDAILLEKSGPELAESFGISHAAARKRLGRALARARHAFLGDGKSQTAAPARFC